MRPTPKTYLAIAVADNAIPTFVLSAIGLLLGVYLRSKLLTTIACVVWYSGFDALVFLHVLRHRATLPHDQNLEALATYRVVQNTIQYSIAVLLWLFFSWREGALFILLWLSGACDIIYYLAVNQFKKQWQSDAPMWWVNFSIPAWFSRNPKMKTYAPFVVSLTLLWIALYLFIR